MAVFNCVNIFSNNGERTISKTVNVMLFYIINEFFQVAAVTGNRKG